MHLELTRLAILQGLLGLIQMKFVMLKASKIPNAAIRIQLNKLLQS